MTQLKPSSASAAHEPRAFPPDIARIVAHASDIAITLKDDGIVQSVILNPSNHRLSSLDHWVGLSIFDVLEDVSGAKLKACLETLETKPQQAISGVELNHVDRASWELPVRYTLLLSGPESDQIVMLGRDLGPLAEVQQQLVNAQLALEQDYEKQRDFETRFRVLLERTRDAFALISDKGLVLNINAAACDLLGESPEQRLGAPLSDSLREGDGEALVDRLLDSADATGDKPVIVRSKGEERALNFYPTAFRSGGDVILLCRIDPQHASPPSAQALRDALQDLYERSCEGVVFTDQDGVIHEANGEFLSFCDLARASDAKGKPLADFLARGGVDLKVLLKHSERPGRLRLYATKMKSPFGALTPVEISAVSLAEKHDLARAFVIRGAAKGENSRDLPGGDDTMRNVMELVGSAPLKDLVAATADVVERMCIETAVELTRNNRVAAAELLGLSRQSLYVKLRKYDLLRRDAEE